MHHATRIAAAISQPDAGLLLGLLLLAAIVGGYTARSIHVPRVVGYLIAGVALHWILAPGTDETAAGGTWSWEAATKALQVVKTLALGLIMFVIGNVFEVRHVRSVGSRMLKISLIESICVTLLVGGACALAWALSAGDVRSAITAGALLGAVAVATAPAATLLVLREYDAKGHVSDTILTATAINNTVSILLFHVLFVIFSWSGLIASTAAESRLVWLDLILTSVGSMVLGCMLGFLFSVLHAKVTLAEFMLVFFAVLIGLGAGADALSETLHLSFNFLLTCLFMGAVFTNITLDSGALYETLRIMGVPLFAAFFVIAGFELHIDDLGELGLIGVLYVAMRTAGKYIGVRLGTRWAGWHTELSPHVGLGLLCQAGIAIGLADFLYNEWVVEAGGEFVAHPVAAQFKSVVLGSVVMFELIGPLVLKSVVKSAGEVKAITLLRRRKPTPVEGESVTRQTWEAMMRTFGLRRTQSAEAGESVTARHIMRSNIKFIRDSAKLDEVLHFVEGSRYNHFPVVDADGAFVGMIHFADLREMIYDPHMRDLVTAIDLACPDDWVEADTPLDALLERFKESDVGSLVVVDSAASRQVKGLVEQRDLLRALHAADADSSRRK